MTPDPADGNASSQTPQSWNRYVYVNGDPANGNDPSGLCTVVGTGLTGLIDGCTGDDPALPGGTPGTIPNPAPPLAGGACGAVSYNASQTAAPAACNTIAATVFSQGLLTWSAVSTSSSFLSQATAINQVDIAILGENAQAQSATAAFWIAFYQSGTCQNSDPAQCVTLAKAATGLPFDDPNGQLQVSLPPPSGSPPQPYVLGGLTLPFAPNPAKPVMPKCGAGQELISSGPGAFSCAVIPKAPRP